MNISQMNSRNVREIFSDTRELANALLCIAEDSDPSTAYYLMESANSLVCLYRDACAMQKHIKRNANFLQQALAGEREACAKVVERYRHVLSDDVYEKLERAIRLRGVE
jgi:hypothetical protein